RRLGNEGERPLARRWPGEAAQSRPVWQYRHREDRDPPLVDGARYIVAGIEQDRVRVRGTGHNLALDGLVEREGLLRGCKTSNPEKEGERGRSSRHMNLRGNDATILSRNGRY